MEEERRGERMTTAEEAWNKIAGFELYEKTKLLAMLAEDVHIQADIQKHLLNRERRMRVRLARKLNGEKNKEIENALDDENI
mgnify:CR=1 FL=1